ncbi:MAG: UDP-N-acetylmuramate dehydrogenase [Desulfomonile tiedjei]|uniref:UDP-N-acetylenolpyruvoylglucosamine reductase n=1 Tax=Desulfomonile tiedjei TaxID=2358 RepID=A0A9D6Z2V9_9BACT|nr:UDP-N-acetylmuramate dehydrogenase [Desulfomonile tiedjei]
MTPTGRQIDDIRNLIRASVTTDVALSRFTSFKIGGPSDLVIEPKNLEELKKLILYLDQEKITRVVLGAGTNVLFHDKGFRGVVIRTAALDSLEIHENGSDFCKVLLAAGAPLPHVVSMVCRHGLKGLEPLWGIPGSLGGAVVTNAGAGDVCIGEFLESVKLVNRCGRELAIGRGDLKYGYRYMSLPQGSTVVEGILKLSRGDKDSITEELERSKARRRGKQPLDRPNAGCVFKNPSPDNPAGAVIDRLGFKGVCVGGAEVSPIHANFIVNRGNATAANVLELIEQIRSTAYEKANVNLDLEICVIGEDVGND